MMEQRPEVSFQGVPIEFWDYAALRRLEMQLGREIVSLRAEIKQRRAAIKQRQVRNKRNKPIKHLVATQFGDKWVAELLPKDDYADIREKIPTVDRFLSKPVGYRLRKGFSKGLREFHPLF